MRSSVAPPASCARPSRKPTQEVPPGSQGLSGGDREEEGALAQGKRQRLGGTELSTWPPMTVKRGEGPTSTSGCTVIGQRRLLRSSGFETTLSPLRQRVRSSLRDPIWMLILAQKSLLCPNAPQKLHRRHFRSVIG